MLAHVEDRHDHIEGMGHDPHGHPHLEEILEEHEGVHVVHVVGAGDHGDQLIAQYEGDDHARDGDDDGIGEAAYHGKDTAVPALGGLPNLTCDLAGLLIDIGEHVGQVGRDHAGEELAHPFLYLFKQSVKHGSVPPIVVVPLIRTGRTAEGSAGCRSRQRRRPP